MTNSSWDTRHRFTFNGFYQLPFGHGLAFMSHQPAFVDVLLGGWSTNLTYQLQSGKPCSVSTANEQTVVGGTAYAILVRNPFNPGGTPNPSNPSITCPTSVRNKAHTFNPCAFANPLPASLIKQYNPQSEATAKLFLGGRSNQIYGPGIQRMDMSVFKRVHTTESQYLELRADCFNVLNAPIYGTPSTTSIGQSGGQITGARQLQLYAQQPLLPVVG